MQLGQVVVQGQKELPFWRFVERHRIRSFTHLAGNESEKSLSSGPTIYGLSRRNPLSAMLIEEVQRDSLADGKTALFVQPSPAAEVHKTTTRSYHPQRSIGSLGDLLDRCVGQTVVLVI